MRDTLSRQALWATALTLAWCLSLWGTGTVVAQGRTAGSVTMGQAAEPASNETVLKELRAIRDQQEELNLRLARIEKFLESKPSAAVVGEDHEGGPDTEALSKIKLPDHPTKEDARKYVRDIVKASRGQNSFSDDDPQIAMLENVGQDNVDILIGAFDLRGSEYHLLPAIIALAGDVHKKMILDALPRNHELVSVVVAKGWVPDAKETLIAELKRRPEYVPTEWIDAVASLEDPTTYDLLTSYLVNGYNPRSTYESIKHLPRLDLNQAVADMWARHKDAEGLQKGDTVRIAFDYGHLDALEQAVMLLSTTDVGDYWRAESRKAIFRVTGFRGSDEEFRKWFDQNKDKLVFDPKARKYVVGKPE